ncbi:KH domain-containing protein [Melia azedarach]|uniref:KH domain-containing protein n=1 Tax=Melia azedarach TaxID=155640 RepID=A0ACC1X6Z6_MELAZ|nr:KH domain-containing protein [Melia azedarach]
MDVNKRNYFKKRPNNQFKRKGGSIKKGKWIDSSHEQSLGNSQPADTVYRILCPSRKIGGVIGKGGNIVKALREETQAKITVADSVPGSEERVIIIYSSPTKISRKNTDEDSAAETEKESMEPHCAAQDALLKVHDRIIEEDLFGGMASDDDNENNTVSARLLVPNNMVGCLLGKRGDVIQRLRSETGANLRVLPADRLPRCAMSTDELVQISGKPEVAKRALYEVSTLLHQNPRKDKPPSSFPVAYGDQSFHPPAAPMPNMHPPANSAWPPRNSSSHGIPPSPWMGGYGDQPSGFGPGGFNGDPPAQREASAEFSMKILCSAGKIGGVIGKGGFNVKQLQQETGASIHVEDASTESDERVIRVSAFEGLWNPRSQTIDAILQLQNKTSEFSEKGTITTRLLVPSSKVGCILGQGGHVINEMRRRTQADIRVYSKDDKPKCASEDEELVQISGNFGVAKDALAEVASRLRVRTLRDANVGAEPASVGPAQRLGSAGSLQGRGPPPSAPVRVGISGGYEPLRGGYDYEPRSYPGPPSATGYPNVNSALEARIPNNAVSSITGTRGSNMSNVGEVIGTRVKIQDPQSGGSECIVDIRRSSEHLTSAHSIYQSFMTSAGHNMNAQPVPYQNMGAPQSSYQDMGAPQSLYQNIGALQSSYQSLNSQQSPYHNINAQKSPYQNISAQQSSYPINSQHGVYPNNPAPPSNYY